MHATTNCLNEQEITGIVDSAVETVPVPELPAGWRHYPALVYPITHSETDFLRQLDISITALQEGSPERLVLASFQKDGQGGYEAVRILLGGRTEGTYQSLLSGFSRQANDLSFLQGGQLHSFTGEEGAIHKIISARSGSGLSSYCALQLKGDTGLHGWLLSIAETSAALSRRILPASINTAETLPGDYISYGQPSPWIADPSTGASASCIWAANSFFSAIHLRESLSSSTVSMPEHETKLFVFSAIGREELAQLLDGLKLTLETASDTNLSILAEELALKPALPYRAAIVAKDKNDLVQKLAKASSGIRKTERSPARFKYGPAWNTSGVLQPRVAGIFPGQGAQRIGMLKDLCLYFPSVRSWFDHLEAALAPVNNILPSLTLFPPAWGLTEEQRAQLVQNLYSQEGGSAAVIVASLALYELLQSFGCTPDVLVGHSSGEISAMIASGILRFTNRNELFETIRSINSKGAAGDARGEIPKGRFLAVTAPDERVLEAFLQKQGPAIYLAMDNCPQQRVLFFAEENAERLQEELSSLGVLCFPLYFDRAYHTELFEVEMPSVREVYDSFELHAPQVPVFSCIRLAPFPHQSEWIKEWAGENWTHCVRFREACEKLSGEGVQTFLEIGPGGVLSGFVDNTLSQRPHKALPLDVDGHDGYVQFLNVLANLFIEGVPLRLEKLFEKNKSILPPAEDKEPTAEMVPQPVQIPDAKTSMSRERQSLLMQQHFMAMNEFLTMEARLFQEIGKRRAPKTAARINTGEQTVADLPMIDAIISRNAQQCISRRTLSRQRDLFLQHHTLGRFILKQPKDTAPLPVVPLALTIEMMAEAASLLAPEGFVVTEIAQLQALRWMTVDEETLTLQLEASWIEILDERKIKLRVLEEGDETHPYCTAIITLREHYPAAPAPMPFEAEVPAQLIWDAESFFEQCLFHGEAFSCMDKLTRLGNDTIELDLSIPRSELLFANTPDPVFKTPAQLLDVPGHATAWWQVEKGDKFFGTFPFSIDKLEFFAPPPSPSTTLLGRGKNTISGSLIGSHFEVSQQGAVLMKISGLKLVYYRFESSFLKSHYWTGPNTYYSDDLPLDNPQLIGFGARSLNRDFLEQSGGLWLRSLVHMFCNSKEKKEWQSLPQKGGRREQWLLGRIAAKEIVRRWAFHYHFIYILCPDIEIAVDDQGRPFAVCPELESFGPLPDLSITHSGPQAIAIAAPAGYRVGVDLEDLESDSHRRPPEFNERMKIAFSPQELERLAPGANLYALVCAKEAASKAVGTGFLGHMLEWEVVSLEGNKVQIEAMGEEIDVELTCTDKRILAYCLLPEEKAARIARAMKPVRIAETQYD